MEDMTHEIDDDNYELMVMVMRKDVMIVGEIWPNVHTKTITVVIPRERLTIMLPRSWRVPPFPYFNWNIVLFNLLQDAGTQYERLIREKRPRPFRFIAPPALAE